MSEDRLTQKDIALAKARMKYSAANKNKKKTQDRLTQEDVMAESRMPYLEANQDKTQDRLTQTDIAQAKARMPYLAANKRHGGAIKGKGAVSKKLKPMKAGEGAGIETAKKHKKWVEDKLDTARGYAREMLGETHVSSKKDTTGKYMDPMDAYAASQKRFRKVSVKMKEQQRMKEDSPDFQMSAMGNPMKAGGSAIKGKGAVSKNRGMGLQDERLQPGETTVVGKGADYIKDLI
jgi:hypothetical protein